MLSDFVIDQVTSNRLKRRERPSLVKTHQPTISRDVGGKDSSEAAFHVSSEDQLVKNRRKLSFPSLQVMSVDERFTIQGQCSHFAALRTALAEACNPSALLIAVVRNNIIPFVGRGAGDEGHDRFRVAHVEDFVRHARFDVDEIAGLVLQRLLEPGSELVAHFSFDDIKDDLEADMNMGIGDATRRYGGDIGG